MSYEFGIIIADTPNAIGPFAELERTETDDFAGEWLPWDKDVPNYSGWNHAAANKIAGATEGASYELIANGNQSYVRLCEREKELARFETRLANIQEPVLRRRCQALATGCRQALARDRKRAVLLVF
jgi:hypothetical protein